MAQVTLKEIREEFDKEIKSMFTDYINICKCGHYEYEHYNFNDHCYFVDCECSNFEKIDEEIIVDEHAVKKIWNFIERIYHKIQGAENVSN